MNCLVQRTASNVNINLLIILVQGLASPGVNIGESAASTGRAGGSSSNAAVGGAAFFPSNSAAAESLRSSARPERFSDSANFCYQNYNQSGASNGNVKSGNMNELVDNFQIIDQSKKQQKSDGGPNATLQAFDPLVHSKSVETLTDTELNVNVNTNIGGSTQTLVPENMALSPDQGFASSGAHSDHGHFETSSSTSVNRDSGLPSESASLDTISEDVGGGLKLTEQQNVHIDGHRLSTAALTLFDPLMQESSTDPEDIDLYSTGMRDASKQSLNDQGGKSKGGNNAPSSTPRISVQSSDQDNSGRALVSLFAVPGGRRESGGRPVPDQEIMKTADGDNAFMHSLDSSNKYAHRGSTDSNSSSLVDISTPRRGEVIMMFSIRLFNFIVVEMLWL